jgi:hypothetical protein
MSMLLSATPGGREHANLANNATYEYLGSEGIFVVRVKLKCQKPRINGAFNSGRIQRAVFLPAP